MDRAYFYVLLSDDRWAVRVGGTHVPALFDRKAKAVRAAIDAAEDQWKQTGQPTGVRVQLSNGRWEDERIYGNDP